MIWLLIDIVLGGLVVITVGCNFLLDDYTRRRVRNLFFGGKPNYAHIAELEGELGIVPRGRIELVSPAPRISTTKYRSLARPTRYPAKMAPVPKFTTHSHYYSPLDSVNWVQIKHGDHRHSMRYSDEAVYDNSMQNTIEAKLLAELEMCRDAGIKFSSPPINTRPEDSPWLCTLPRLD